MHFANNLDNFEENTSRNQKKGTTTQIISCRMKSERFDSLLMKMILRQVASCSNMPAQCKPDAPAAAPKPEQHLLSLTAAVPGHTTPLPMPHGPLGARRL